jgi:hypothetical protein
LVEGKELFEQQMLVTVRQQLKSWSRRFSWLNVLCIETQICHATQVKEHAFANTYKAKEYVLASGAPRHDAGSMHV